MTIKRRLLLIFLIFIMTITMKNNVSHAATYALGDEMEINYTDLTTKEGLYCIQYGGHVYNVINGVSVKGKYKINKHINIKGKTTIFENLSGQKKEVTTGEEGTKMAYILANNYNDYYRYSKTKDKNDYTLRQKLVWYEWNKFSNEIKSYIGINLNGEENNKNNEYDPENEIKNVDITKAEEYQCDIKAEATSIESKGLSTGYEKIGPIKVTYTGKISSVTIKDNEDKQISSEKLEFYQNGNKINSSKIQSEKEFYVINKSGKDAKNINIKVLSEETYNVDIWVLENIGVVDLEGKRVSGKDTTGWQRLILVETKKEYNEDEINITVKSKKEGSIKIIKKDTSSGETLNGAKFKIFTQMVNEGSEKEKNYWLAVDNATDSYIYTSNYENATEFTSGENGEITINNLKEKISYKIYEIKAPEGYELKEQDGYNEKNDWVWCNQKVYNITSNNIVSITVENTKQEPINIQGYVWIEKPGSKTNEYNDILDNGEDIITDKVTITLRDKSNNDEIVASNPEIITENAYNGIKVLCYKFKGIDYNKLKDYYVHFDYSKKYPGHITVTPNFGVAEGSKAILNDVPDEDKYLRYSAKDYAIATTYKGKESKDEAEYGLSGLATKFYNEKTYTLENINLGIKELKDPDYTVTETLAYVDISIKGYNYRYYQGEKKPAVPSAPRVRIQIKSDLESYTREIYPADTLYESENKAQELKVYVTYRIDVTNNEQLDIENLYQEKFLNVKNVINAFDKDRYELADEERWTKIGEGEEYAYARIKEDYLNERYYDKEGKGITNNQEIDPDTLNAYNDRYAYIRLSIKEEKLKELLTLGEGKKAREKQATKVQITANHEYTRKDSSWKNNTEATQTHHTVDKVKQEKAAFLDLKLGQNRTISGKVFEDKKVEERPQELIGDGIYNNDENKIKDVKVELGNYEENENGEKGEFKVSNLYQVNKDGKAVIYEYDENGNRKEVLVNSENEKTIRDRIKNGEYGSIFNKAETTTESDGTYSFVGVVPGEYFMRFTYGDGTQTIYDSKGEIVKDEEGNEKKVSSDEYKSTIVTKDVQDAFEKYKDVLSSYDKDKEAGTATWYMNLENHNLAVDDLAQRARISEGKYDITAAILRKRKASKAEAITAETPLISIPIEYTSETIGDENEQYSNEINNIDFGIIELPKTRIEISKKITNIKLTLQNGQVLMEGNPGTQNIAYTTDLDRKTEGGSTYVKVELDSEYIYGGTLEIKYEIEVTNNSDLDYIEKEKINGKDNPYYGYYYKYGIISNYAEEKKVIINKVYDYLDPKISYSSKEGDQEVKTIDVAEFKNKDENILTDEQKEILELVGSIQQETGLDFKEIIEIANWKELYSNKGKETDKSSDKISINAKKLLSSGEDDLEFINIAEVVEITTDKITPANVELPKADTTETTTIGSIGKTKKAKLTVTPSTGENRSVLYFAIGTMALVVLAGGIVVIKKRVIK